MFEHMTEAAKSVLFAARDEAVALGGLPICTEHLLLALLSKPEAGIVKLTAAVALAPATLYATLHDELVSREREAAAPVLPFSDGVKRALRFAEEDGRELTGGSITPAHMLLGVLRDEGSVASRLLTKSGFTVAAMRQQIRADSH
jgi:ATP-dependent Clp protease ATP-binding subunit ClpA